LEVFDMRVAVVVLSLICLVGSAGFAATFSLTMAAEKDFAFMPTAEEAVAGFSTDPAPLWGFGWEVVLKRFGLGGTYFVKFFENDGCVWALDWNGQPLYVSYHFFGGKAFLDPFIMAGYPVADLYLSLHPFVGAGLGLHLGDFNVGASLSYIPFDSGIPATDIPRYSTGNYQVTAYAGVTLGRR
jgi:hypothetical protein